MSRHQATCYKGRDHSSQGLTGYAVAVALIHVPTQTGTLVRFVCRRHLDEWLDIADEQPQWEPTTLVWIE